MMEELPFVGRLEEIVRRNFEEFVFLGGGSED